MDKLSAGQRHKKAAIKHFVNDIWMNDHQIIAEPYPQFEEEEGLMKAAEEEI